MDALRFNVFGGLFLIRREGNLWEAMHWEQMEGIRPPACATIHRMRAAEDFPGPMLLGTRRGAFRLKDVQDWLSSLPTTQ
jgi:predicted DNA-binding transcriptional regulator AlpA